MAGQVYEKALGHSQAAGDLRQHGVIMYATVGRRRPSPVRDMHDVKTSNKKVIAAANSSRVSIAFKKISTKAEFFFSFSLIIQESYHAGVCIRGLAKILRLRAELIFPLRTCSLAR